MTSSGAATDGWPVRFAGKLEEKDGQPWVDNWKSTRIARVVQDGVFAIAIVAGLAVYWLQVTERDIYIWPIMYFVAGLFMLQPYQSLRERHSDVRSMKRGRQDFEKSEHCHGAFDLRGGHWRTDAMSVKFSWECVRSVAVGFNACTLTFWGTEWSVYLPSRIFESSADYHRLSLFLHRQFIRDAEHLPRLEHLQSVTFGKTDIADDGETQAALDWTAASTSGPYSSRSAAFEELDTFTYTYWPLEHRSRKAIVKSVAEHLSYALTHYLPIHVMMVCWLIADRIHYGHWGFVFQHQASLLFWGFYLIALVRAGAEVFANYRGHLSQQMLKVALWVNPVCLCSRQGDFVMWIPFQERMRRVKSSSEIGWEVPGDPEWKFAMQRKNLSDLEALKLEDVLAKSVCGQAN